MPRLDFGPGGMELSVLARGGVAGVFVSGAPAAWPPAFLNTASKGLSVPRIQSAKKNMRKSKAAAERNRAQRAALRTAIKKAKAQGASAADKLKAATLLDRAARKGLIHRNAAGRHKSRIAK